MNKSISKEEKIEMLKVDYDFYLRTDIFLSNEKIGFYDDISYEKTLSEDLKLFLKQSKQIDSEQIQMQMDVLLQAEHAKEDAERTKEELVRANEQLSEKTEEALKALESERQFNKDFERIKAQNNLAEKFLFAIVFLIIFIVGINVTGVFLVEESQMLTKQEKNVYIIELISSATMHLKDLIILLIGILSGIYSYLFYFKNQSNFSNQKKKQGLD
jgi:hypothetical protein